MENKTSKNTFKQENVKEINNRVKNIKTAITTTNKTTIGPNPAGPRGASDQNPPNFNQKLRSLKICTYNVRSLSSTERFIELTEALEEIDHDVVGLAEVRRNGCDIEEHTKHIFCFKGETKGLFGVGFLIKKQLKECIVNFTGISERVAILKLRINNETVSLIQVYAPTAKSKDEEIEKFYNDLTSAHDLIDETVLVMGDFNAKIGKPQQHEQLILGQYGYGIRNERGERMLQYAYENKLSIMNSYFKKKQSRMWTWCSPDGKTKNEVDFIMSNKPKYFTNIEVLNKVNYPSDHRIIRASLTITKLKKNRKTFNPITRMLKTESDINNYIKNLEVGFSNRISTFHNLNCQEYYDSLTEIILYSLRTKEIEKDNKNKKHKILKESTLDLIKKRTALTLQKNKTRKMKDELKEIYKKAHKAIREDYKKYRKEIFEKNLRNFRSEKRALKELNTHKKWIQSLGDNQEKPKTRKDILECATTFYKELYSKAQNENSEEETILSYEGTSEIGEVTESEILQQIKKLKYNKSPGPDNISNEALKWGAQLIIPFLKELFNMVFKLEQVPHQWCKSDIILLYKKGDPKEINNYRPISLLATIYKVFSSLLLNRITTKIEERQPLEQAGFRSGFSTTDHIHAIEQLLEKFKEFNQPLYIGFIDYRKAFDTISHCAIWKALRSCNVETKYINIIKTIYSNSTSNVRLEKTGEDITINRGVRQGDPLSPKLFIAVLENIFQNLDWKYSGIWIHGKHLSHLRFADDIVVFAKSPLELEKMMQDLNRESKKVGLHMNAEKTNIMSNSHHKLIQIEGIKINYVTDYIYLGKKISFDPNSNEEEVERRIRNSWKSFWTRKEILKGNYDMEIKRTVMDTCILPCLTYACQTWTYTKKIRNRLLSTQHAMERSILRLKKTYKTKNKDIRHRTKLTDTLKHALKMKWQWAGHIARYTDKRWTSLITKWSGPLGKRKKGRPKKRWVDDIIPFAGVNWMNTVKNKTQWKEMEEAFTQMGSKP